MVHLTTEAGTTWLTSKTESNGFERHIGIQHYGVEHYHGLHHDGLEHYIAIQRCGAHHAGHQQHDDELHGL